MPEVPNIWRVELLHPLVVHFPIALLWFGTLAWLAGHFPGDDSRWSFLLPAGRLAIALGTAGAWIAVYTGSLADAAVVRSLCDPTVVESHEQLAYLVAYLFSGALFLDLATSLVDTLRRWRRPISALIALTLLAGSITLAYVGHLGATLVYQQAAGVYHPSPQCTEFE